MSKKIMIGVAAAGLTLTTAAMAQAGQNDSRDPNRGGLFQAFAAPGWGAYGAYGFGGPGPGAYAYAPRGLGLVSERSRPPDVKCDDPCDDGKSHQEVR
jgi:hypothetical protein